MSRSKAAIARRSAMASAVKRPCPNHRHGRRGDAEGRGRGAGRWTAVMIPIASGVRV